MANVVTVEHGDGSVSAGFDVDGVFVPVATVSASRIAHLKERSDNLSDLLESDDPEEVKRAEDAVSQLPISSKPAKSKGGAE